MGVRANYLFVFIMIISILFLALYKPFGLIDIKNNDKIPMIELYDFSVYSLNQKINKIIYAQKALQYDDVIKFKDFTQQTTDNKTIDNLSATFAEYFNNKQAKFYGNVKYSTKKGNYITTTYAKYDMIKKIVLGDKRFHISIDNYDMYGIGFIYNINDETLKQIK